MQQGSMAEMAPGWDFVCFEPSEKSALYGLCAFTSPIFFESDCLDEALLSCM